MRDAGTAMESDLPSLMLTGLPSLKRLGGFLCIFGSGMLWRGRGGAGEGPTNCCKTPVHPVYMCPATFNPLPLPQHPPLPSRHRQALLHSPSLTLVSSQSPASSSPCICVWPAETQGCTPPVHRQGYSSQGYQSIQ